MDDNDKIRIKLDELKKQRTPKYKDDDKQKNFYVGVVKNTPYMPDLTMINLMSISNLLNRRLIYITVTGSALTVARRNLFNQIKENIIKNGDDVDLSYVLLIDSDILIRNSPNELSEIFKEAEQKDINISGYYKKVNNTSVIIGVGSNDEYPVLLDEQHEDWNKYNNYIPTYKKWYYPIGFYYGRYLPYNYIWRMDNKGEDIYFNEDNDFLWSRTYVDKRIKLAHIKEISIY
ncbi:MAG: hypothetical protein ACP5U0_08065 [Caldisphaera sp.]